MMMVTPRQTVSPFMNLSEDVEQGIGDALDYLEDSFETTNILPSTRIGLTPVQYTPLGHVNRSIEYNSKKKRVEFSPWTKYLSAPNHQDQNSENAQLLKPLPSSRPSKFVKSILKPHSNSSPLRETDHNIVREPASPSQKIDTFGGMLDTVVEQLASESTDLRLDAYIVFQGALRAFDYNVDKNILSRKAKLLQSFLQRDITAPAGTTAIDSQLAVQALKTLMALLRNVVFQDCIEDCFGASLLDRSVAVLTDELASKQVITHHLQVLAMQRFSRKIVNGDRAERILSALIGVEKRCRGSSVIGARLLIYQRLLVQNKPIMISRISEWLEHLFDGIFCTVKEVRNRSIDISVNIALSLSGNSHCVRAVLELFDRDVDSGLKYATFITNNLSERLANVEETLVIPQIWVIPILFLRCRLGCLEQWKYLKLWLSIIQKCMAVGDLRARVSAYHAWNQFVWAVDPDLSTTDTMKSLMLRPIILGLDRSVKDKVFGKARIIYLNSYCNLLYYSFRPGSSFDHLDTYWARYVRPVLEKMALQGTKEASRACCILASLFRTNKTYTWDENRANESRRFHIEELPQLEPKWIRLRMKSIATTVSTCFRYASWSADAGVSPPVQRMWTALMEALAEAGSKEINASMELKEALAQIMNLLRELWSTIASLGDVEDTLDSRISHFSFLVETSITILKPSHYLHSILFRSQVGYYSAAPSASKNMKGNEGQRAPITEIFEWFQTSSVVQNDIFESLIGSTRSILQSCCDSQASRRILISRLLHVIQTSGKSDHLSSSIAFTEPTWLMLVELVLSADDAASELAAQCGESSFVEGTTFLNVIQTALTFKSPATSKGVRNICECYAEHVKSIAGSDGLVVLIVEPLAEILVNEHQTANVEHCIDLCNYLVKLKVHPHSRRSIEKAAQLLNIPYNRGKRSQFDPYKNLSTLITQILDNTYTLIEEVESESIVNFINYLTLFIEATPLSQVAILLRRLQTGLVLWIEDPKRQLKAVSGLSPNLLQAVCELWSKVLLRLQHIPKKNSILLSAVDDLLVAGFSSCHEEIAGGTMKFWDSSFAQEESFEFPAKLLECLSCLRKQTQTQLPAFPMDGSSKSISNETVDIADLKDESAESYQERLYDTAKEEIKMSVEPPLSVSAAPVESAEPTDTEDGRSVIPVENADKLTNTLQALPEERLSATDDSENVLSEQSQLDSQLLAENQSAACNDSGEQLQDGGSVDLPATAGNSEETPTGPRASKSSTNEDISLNPGAKIARGMFLREFYRLNKMNDSFKNPDSSVETEDGAVNEGSAETSRRATEADVELPVLNDSAQRTSDDSTKDVISTHEDEAKEALPTTPDMVTLVEEQPLIEQSIFVSDAPPSSDIDAVVAADSLLLPSEEIHPPEDRERFSTPLDSIDIIDSSAEDASTPWQSYLNSSPPTSVGNDGISTIVHERVQRAWDIVPNQLHNTQGPAQKASDQGPVQIEHHVCEKAVQYEESSTLMVEDSVLYTDMNTEKSPTRDENANSMKGATKSSGNVGSVTKKRSASFVGSDEARKRFKADNSSPTHNGRDMRHQGLARATSANTCQDDQEDITFESEKEDLPPPPVCINGNKSKGVEPSPKQNLSRAESKPANTDITEEEPSSPSSSGTESKEILKRRRSRRYDVDIEHVQLTTPPKRRRRSARHKSPAWTGVSSAEHESSAPRQTAHLRHAEKEEDDNNDNNDGNGQGRIITVDQGTASTTEKIKQPTQNAVVDENINNNNNNKNNSNDHNEISLHPHPHHPPPPCSPPSPSPSPSPSSLPSTSQNTPTRQKAKPASIMGRLRRVLSDCRQLVLGSQEEREFDDVLFEVRKEVHEAGRRGRDGRGR